MDVRTMSIRWMFPLVLVVGSACQPSTRGARQESKGTSQRVPPRLLLIGLDGADPGLLERFMEEGRLPTFSQLRDEGHYSRLASEVPTLSPRLWTTIATGKSPEAHGVTDFFRSGEGGKRIAFESSHVRAKRFWNIVSDHGHASCVIYWWITWPVEEFHGVMVSDFLYYLRNARTRGQNVSRGPVRSESVHPPELLPWVMERLQTAKELSPGLVRSVVPLSDARLQRFMELDPRFGKAGAGTPLAVLKNKLIESELHRSISVDLMRANACDLATYYSKGIDASEHVFFRHFEPASKPEGSPHDFAKVIPNFYEYEDRNIATLLAQTTEETYTLILSDHGHHVGGHSDAPDGVFFLRGPGVRTGSKPASLELRDVAPLILYLMDVPVGRDMSTERFPALFTPEHLAARPVRFVETHETGTERPAARNTPIPQGLEDELEALGYIE